MCILGSRANRTPNHAFPRKPGSRYSEGMNASRRELRSFQFSLRSLLLVMVGLATLLALGVGIERHVMAPAREAKYRHGRMQCFEVVWLALVNYHDVYRALPSMIVTDRDGQELHSWRSGLIHFGTQLGIDFVLPNCEVSWRHPNNANLAAHGNFMYSFSESGRNVASVNTFVVAVVGEGTVFANPERTPWKDVPSDAILLIELADSGRHWMEPGDFDIADLDARIVKGRFGKGLIVCFSDGDVWILSPTTPVPDLAKFMTITGAEEYDRDSVLGPYCLAKTGSRGGHILQ